MRERENIEVVKFIFPKSGKYNFIDLISQCYMGQKIHEINY